MINPEEYSEILKEIEDFIKNHREDYFRSSTVTINNMNRILEEIKNENLSNGI